MHRTLRLLQVKQFNDRRGLVVLRDSAMMEDGSTVSATCRGFVSMTLGSTGRKVAWVGLSSSCPRHCVIAGLQDFHAVSFVQLRCAKLTGDDPRGR